MCAYIRDEGGCGGRGGEGGKKMLPLRKIFLRTY